MMLLLAISMVAGMKVGNASRYGYEGDVFDRVGSFACRRTLNARYGERGWQKMREHGVAHRTLACGTRLSVCNVRTNQCTMAFVVDRGPWGVLDRKGEWHVRTSPLRPGEHYRGDLDLLPGTYSAIALAGIEKVAYWQLGREDAAQARTHHRLPPLRSGGRSPFAVNLRTPMGLEQEFPPLRSTELGSGQKLALNDVAPALGDFPPLRSQVDAPVRSLHHLNHRR